MYYPVQNKRSSNNQKRHEAYANVHLCFSEVYGLLSTFVVAVVVVVVDVVVVVVAVNDILCSHYVLMGLMVASSYGLCPCKVNRIK